MELPRELELIAAACRAAYDRNAPLPTFEGVDEGRLMRMARFHRVQGLVWRGVRDRETDLPAGLATALAQDAAEIAAANLRSAAESGKLQRQFDEAGIPLIFVKGLTLAALIYGEAWSKSAVDMDLLVDGARLEEAVAILRSCGFRRSGGRPEETAALRAWHRFRKDSEWAKPGSAARVDLHTRLTDNPALLAGVGLDSPRQMVEIAPGIRLPCLAEEELFAHLCVHGASSAWFRLKWITDLAALLRPKTGDAITRLYRRSQELGAGRAAAQALLLADRISGSLAGCPELRDNLSADRSSRWLYRQALRQLAGGQEPVEPTARPGGTLRIHLTQFLLLPGIGFKASELVRQTRAALG